MEKNDENKMLQIKDFYESGLSTIKISKELKISQKLIIDYLKDKNLLKNSRLSKEDEEKIISLYEEGKEIDYIMKLFPKDRSTINNVLRKNKVKRRSRSDKFDNKNEEYINSIKDLYEKGFNSYEIGERLYKSYHTILHHLKKMGVERRSIKKIDDKKFKEMWDNGATDEELMKEFNMTRNSIRQYRSKNNMLVIQWFSQTEQKLSEIQEQMILGSILGDMSIKYNKKGRNANLCLVHCEAQKDLFMKKVEILGDFMGYYKLVIPKPDSRTGKVYNGYRGASLSHPVFKKLYDIIYINNKKIITKEYLDMIYHPISLAYWFMDDGSSRGVFATNGFSPDEVDLLINFLLEKFNIVTTKRITVKDQYVIYISSDSRKRFEDLIRPYMIDQMKYKLKYKV